MRLWRHCYDILDTKRFALPGANAIRRAVAALVMGDLDMAARDLASMRAMVGNHQHPAANDTRRFIRAFEDKLEAARATI